MQRIILALAALALTACGGGGGNHGVVSSSMISEAPPNDEPSISSTQAANPQATQDAASDAANNLPNFGSVAQSSNYGSVAGISSDAATV